jgi:hypothetical protein
MGLRYRGVAGIWGKSGESPALSRNGMAVYLSVESGRARMPTCELWIEPFASKGKARKRMLSACSQYRGARVTPSLPCIQV